MLVKDIMLIEDTGFKIDDICEIEHPGKVFSSYDHMVGIMMLNIENWLNNYSPKYGTRIKIIKLEKHEIYKIIIAACELLDGEFKGKFILMNVLGLNKIEENLNNQMFLNDGCAPFAKPVLDVTIQQDIASNKPLGEMRRKFKMRF